MANPIVFFLSGDRQFDASLLQSRKDGIFQENKTYHFVHIVDDVSLDHLPPDVPTNNGKAIEEYYQKEMHSLAQAFKEKDQEFKFHVLFHKEAKLRAVNFLEEVEAVGCVVATRGQQGVEGIFAESFAYFLVANAPCDVLVIRPHEGEAS